jgi:tRNA threonylcarbamoyladenosine modification (KEOPS) complex Cgi121 subunit
LPRSAVMLYSKIIDGATGAFWAAMAGKNVAKSDRGEICMVLDVAM